MQRQDRSREDLAEVGVWRKSPTLNVYPDRLVREAYSLRAKCQRALDAAARQVGPVDEFDTIATANVEWLNIVVELGRRLGVDWDQPLPVVQRRDDGDDFED